MYSSDYVYSTTVRLSGTVYYRQFYLIVTLLKYVDYLKVIPQSKFFTDRLNKYIEANNVCSEQSVTYGVTGIK